MKKTPWFPAEVFPHRPGVYECDWREIDWMGGRYFNHWDGSQWFLGSYFLAEHKYKRWKYKPISAAAAARSLIRWRGVLADSKRTKTT